MQKQAPLTVAGLTFRNLFRQRVRTSLTVLGVSLGVVAIVAFHSLVRGAYSMADDLFRTGGASLTVQQAGIAANILSALSVAEVRPKLESDPDVVEAAPVVLHPVPLATNQLVQVVIGIDPNAFPVQIASITQGRRAAAPNEVVFGDAAARRQNLEVGATVELMGLDYRLVGTFASEIPFYDAALLTTLEGAQTLAARPGKATLFLVKLREGADPVVVGERIEQANPGLATIAGVEDLSKVDRGVEMTQAMVYAISLIALIIGAIIVTNTMWMTVLERTREIGILRAVGWSRSRVTQMVLLEAVGVGLMAWLVGSLGGAALAHSTTYFEAIGTFVRPRFDAPPFLLALGIALLLSMIGAIAPAWRATRISPVEALRYE